MSLNINLGDFGNMEAAKKKLTARVIDTATVGTSDESNGNYTVNTVKKPSIVVAVALANGSSFVFNGIFYLSTRVIPLSVKNAFDKAGIEPVECNAFVVNATANVIVVKGYCENDFKCVFNITDDGFISLYTDSSFFNDVSLAYVHFELKQKRWENLSAITNQDKSKYHLILPNLLTPAEIASGKYATHAKVEALKNSVPEASRGTLFNLVYNRIGDEFNVNSIKEVYGKDFHRLLSFIFKLNPQNIKKDS